ncbi:NfeD family protein [Paenibacillus tuaregi]|uniref:NfeD family protein n=1 Tax=Paenibacillus tuaregi TaxID=1816681 RepID=UPI0008390052|nr:NfeD family protein [Paenibacillus tuaregi]
METLFLVLFLIGLVFAVLSIFVGDIFHLHVDVSGGHFPYLSPTTIAAFITVFGGLGYFLIINTSLSQVLISAISVFAAIVVSACMFFFIVVPLQAAHKSTARSAKDLIGKSAVVVSPITGDSRGEIVYEQGGTRLSAPARSNSGEMIYKGETVIVLDEAAGTFLVAKL